MAKLSKAAKEVIGAFYEEGISTVDIRNFLNEHCDLDLPYNTIWDHSPAALKSRAAYRATPEAKEREKTYRKTPEYRKYVKSYGKKPDIMAKARERQRKLYRMENVPRELIPTLRGLVSDAFAEGCTCPEIKEIFRENFGLNLTYPFLIANEPARKLDCRMRKHVERIAAMADRVEQYPADRPHAFLFSTERGERTRKKMLDYLDASPGASLSDIARRLELTDGSIYRHMQRLESEDLVFSVKGANKTHVYPLHKTRHRVYYAIWRNPGITRDELAETAGISENLLKYHAGKLVAEGLLIAEKEDRKIRYTVAGGK